MGDRVQVVPATELHARAIAQRMRAEDLAEVEERYVLTWLLAGLRSSEFARAMLINGEVAMLFGVVASGGEQPVAWALTSRTVGRHLRTFLCACRTALAELLERYERLIGYVDVRFGAAVRWAKWLGFELGEPQSYGPASRPFYLISLRRQ